MTSPAKLINNHQDRMTHIMVYNIGNVNTVGQQNYLIAHFLSGISTAEDSTMEC